MTGPERDALREVVDRAIRAREAGRRELPRRESRDVMRQVVPRRKRGPVNHCIFCGARTYGRACRSHRDLIQIETAAIT